MAVLSKNWRNEIELRKPQRFPVASLAGAEVIVRPMTATRQSAIDSRFPSGENNKILDPHGYSLAIVADSVVDEEGSPVFTEADLLSADGNGVEWPVAAELSTIVSTYLEHGRGNRPKN